MQHFILIVLSWLFIAGVKAQTHVDLLQDYDLSWNTPSLNSSQSMPCGGGDVGLNVWVENGDLLFYIARSGVFDENNTMPKLGRVRITLSPNPLIGKEFSQTLKLHDGFVEIKGENEVKIQIWVEIKRPVVHVEISGNNELDIKASYENWRFQNRHLKQNEGFENSYKWALPDGLIAKRDSISFYEQGVLFYHRNFGETVFDVTVKQQGMEAVKQQLYNPLESLTFGGYMFGDNLVPNKVNSGIYLSTPFKSWQLESRSPSKKHHLEIALQTSSTSMEEWMTELMNNKEAESLSKLRSQTRDWWHQFWQRSFIFIEPNEKEPSSKTWQVGRNYQLFRYMLACNAYGNYPTKFNGGLFTYDPQFVNMNRAFSPDFRNWGGGTFTAQNQRLVYFPMFSSGDFDMIPSQLNFYTRLLGNAELRSKFYWNHKGASFTEQLENFGLPNPSEYGWERPDYFDKGMQFNAWLEHQWDAVLEFCWMAVQLHHYQHEDISSYIPLIKSSLTFFDEHYKYLAQRRGSKTLDEDGKLVFYPGSACETYKMATNSTSTLTALKTLLQEVLKLPERYLDKSEHIRFSEMLERIPETSFRSFHGQTTIAPAKSWERINNTEVPQLYPVFPWGIYGVGKPNLDIARNTYLLDPDVIKFRGHESWKQDNIFAARLGFTQEADSLTILKLSDSGRKFPAFWGPGFDWVPDHNWGGSGMIGLQEMLMQFAGDKILLFPAWPKHRDVFFRLHAPNKTVVEATLKKGKITLLKVWPEEREKDVEIILK